MIDFSNYKHAHYLALAGFIFIILLCLPSCTKSPMISPQHSEILKHYERITVYKGSGKVKTSFEVNIGDYILLLASGQLKLGQRETPIENHCISQYFHRGLPVPQTSGRRCGHRNHHVASGDHW